MAAACRWRIDILSDFGGNRAGQLRRATVAECILCDQEQPTAPRFLLHHGHVLKYGPRRWRTKSAATTAGGNVSASPLATNTNLSQEAS
jgi:hypothetical protein